MTAPLQVEWLDNLALANRRPPELYRVGDKFDGQPHAAALRVAFKVLKLSAVFCVEDVPTIGFLVLDDERLDIVNEIHSALWNQGLMTLLLVFSGDVLRAYSLARLPRQSEPADGPDPRLVDVFERIRDALVLKELVLGAESGRLWAQYPAAFDASERIDQVLLGNLMTAFRQLRDAGLLPAAAQALLMQTMFIAYLEDRGAILEAYFREATGDRVGSFAGLLASRDRRLLESLFGKLRQDFNGDIFLAPCAFEADQDPPPVLPPHFEILERFRLGREVMETGQGRFWGYDFRYIPVVLLSAVYDRFLSQNPEIQRKEGAYYTPMFLADTVVSQVWDTLTEVQRVGPLALDPACGSGIFLVRLFQRLVEHLRATRQGESVSWKELVTTARRLHGMDINASAVRVAVFSLYIALLEQVTPPDIRALLKGGKILPELWRKTLVPESYFLVVTPAPAYDVVIGNPPWTSRRGDTAGAQTWCANNNLPCPGGEAAWGFLWKTERLLAPDGVAGLLLPAMGILHNHAIEATLARSRVLRDTRVLRIINFSDMTFQLFESAKRPTALMVYRRRSDKIGSYQFDYWCPKADLNLRLKRVLTLSRADRTRLRSDFAEREPQVFKRRLWMRHPDEKLLQYLATLPRLGNLVKVYGTLTRTRTQSVGGWVIGQGFQPLNPSELKDERFPKKHSECVGVLPHLYASAYRSLVLPSIGSSPWPTQVVRRVGFSDGFVGPHILVPKGVERDVGRLRAAYAEQDCTFRHSIQAIKFPVAERRRAKLLTAILNSRLIAWFVFHETASLGTERAEVHESELLGVPFPSASDLANPESASAVAEEIISLVDDALTEIDSFLTSGRLFIDEIDRLVYKYFGLGEDEIAVVEDTLNVIIPSMQPRETALPLLWRACQFDDRASYAETLARTLVQWLQPNTRIDISLVGLGEDLAALRLRLVPDSRARSKYDEKSVGAIAEILNRIWKSLPVALPGNFQIIPDLRVVLDGNMYLVKPRHLRYWLRSSALADADEIVADLHRASKTQRSDAPVVHADR